MQELPGFTIIAIALCAAVFVWALRMARSQRRVEPEGLALEQNAPRRAEGGDAPISSSDTVAEASDIAAEASDIAAEGEGPRRYYVRRPASPLTAVAQSELEEPAKL